MHPATRNLMNPGRSESAAPTQAVTTVRRLPILAMLATILAATALTFGTAQEQPVRGIHVSGTGVVYGEPDLARLNLGVTVFALEVRDALAQADTLMAAVRSAAVAAGVRENDIRTTGFFVWRDERVDRDGNPTVERYQVRHSYQIVVRDVDTVAEVLSAVFAAGANSVDGIEYTFADPAALSDQARELAMADARAKAERLAALGGVTLGAPVTISELSGAPLYGYADSSRAFAEAASSVSGGQLAVTVNVQVSYALE